MRLLRWGRPRQLTRTVGAPTGRRWLRRLRHLWLILSLSIYLSISVSTLLFIIYTIWPAESGGLNIEFSVTLPPTPSSIIRIWPCLNQRKTYANYSPLINFILSEPLTRKRTSHSLQSVVIIYFLTFVSVFSHLFYISPTRLAPIFTNPNPFSLNIVTILIALHKVSDWEGDRQFSASSLVKSMHPYKSRASIDNYNMRDSLSLGLPSCRSCECKQLMDVTQFILSQQLH